MNVDRMKEQARQMGADADALARMGLDEAEQEADQGITLLVPNLPAFMLFTACSHQWDTVIAPNGRVIKNGLRWPDVEVRARHLPECRALSEPDTDRLWRDITTLQNAALEYLAEQRSNG